VLLTETPINNDILDLYQQIKLFTRGDRGYFAAAGIGDLQRYFANARRAARSGQSSAALFNLLEEVVIRRTRPFIRRAYPNATIRGVPVRWPERRLRTIRYDLEATYGGIYDRVVDAIEGLRLAPYQLETYKRQGVARDDFEVGREEALAGIFQSRFLKRFESSVDAFRVSVRRALEFLDTFESYVMDGRLLNSAAFHRAMQFLEREDVEDDATPGSLAETLDAQAEARAFLESLPTLDPAQYEMRRLHEALQRDIRALREHLSHPDVERREAVRLMEALRERLPGVYLRTLRSAYQVFGRSQDIRAPGSASWPPAARRISGVRADAGHQGAAGDATGGAVRGWGGGWQRAGSERADAREPAPGVLRVRVVVA
jgi:hypothetical protein